MSETDSIFPLEPVPTDSGEVDSSVSGPLAPAGSPAAQRVRPTPHKSKLEELLTNPKLPVADRDRVQAARTRYDGWIRDMKGLQSTGHDKVRDLVNLLNAYKGTIEIELVWDSEADFLFRQRGQLKVDNSIMEEFLPWLVDPDVIPALQGLDCFAGPASAFGAAYFTTTISAPLHSLGLTVRTKDQDFTLSRRAHLRASFDPNFPVGSTDNMQIWLAYVAAECKTNLDKTMFQSAIADAHDLKVAMPGSRYFVVCEYLDMTPISTAGTDIDEVLVLRGKRLASNKRSRYSTVGGRAQHRQEYLEWLDETPVRLGVIERFVEHLDGLINHVDPDEDDAVARGFF